MHEQREIGESIKRYKVKLELEKQINAQEITTEEVLKNEIAEGKYIELTERRDDLNHIYRIQKMRDLKKAQQEKVKNLSKLHMSKRNDKIVIKTIDPNKLVARLASL